MASPACFSVHRTGSVMAGFLSANRDVGQGHNTSGFKRLLQLAPDDLVTHIRSHLCCKHDGYPHFDLASRGQAGSGWPGLGSGWRLGGLRIRKDVGDRLQLGGSLGRFLLCGGLGCQKPLFQHQRLRNLEPQGVS